MSVYVKCSSSVGRAEDKSDYLKFGLFREFHRINKILLKFIDFYRISEFFSLPKLGIFARILPILDIFSRIYEFLT